MSELGARARVFYGINLDLTLLLEAMNFKAFDFCTGWNYCRLPVAAVGNGIGKTLYQGRLARYLHTSIAFGGVRADGLAQWRADRVSQGVSRTAGIRRDSIIIGTAVVADHNVCILFSLYSDANIAAPLTLLASDGIRRKSLFELRNGKLFTDGNELLLVGSADHSIAAEDKVY